MDRFVKYFIAMSMVYLTAAAILGVVMLAHPYLLTFRFIHSHLMLLGWVSMMIYGVGYHILPRFAGKVLKSKTMGEVQFWTANIGLIGMLFFYALNEYNPDGPSMKMTVVFGAMEVLSIILFFYNMMVTVFSKSEN